MATTMATNLDATKLEQEFRRLRSFVAARLRSSAFQRTTWLLGFVGVVLTCLTLLKIPNVEGGLPFPLNHEILISFAVGSGFGILLNLFVFFMHLLLCINERKLNKTQSPSQELIEKCFHHQKKLITAIHAAEACIIILGSSFWVYVFVVALFGTFLPCQDPNRYTGSSGSLYQTATSFWFLLKISIDGFPKSWGLD